MAKHSPATHEPVLYQHSLLTSEDLFLFNEGTHYRLYDKLGAHPAVIDGRAGAFFAVWAPNAAAVSVIGDFNDWNTSSHFLASRGSSGLWEGFIPGIKTTAHYKFHIVSHQNQFEVDKADPYSFFNQTPPHTASIVWDLAYEWRDREWMSLRQRHNALNQPISIYEVHLGSWRRVLEEGNRSLSYLEMAQQLTEYVTQMGFTHVELLPVMDHPFFGSWGYQTVGYFAPSGSYGTPQDFMTLVDTLHQAGIGVILDWVPSHFPTDEHGLAFFDGTHLFEHADPRQGFHPDWSSYIFNYGRPEVWNFLISSALFWLDKYHIDGLRVDAVASMLYLDYSRKAGEWIPNQFGGHENLDAIRFLRRLNEEVYKNFPDVQTIAEESTAWPMVSRPTYLGGLGFGLKWDMGWMHDTLGYMATDPLFRPYHQNTLTFRMLYAFTENFVLPLSHDEVVHGKGSLLGKMPGDEWQRFANMRLLFSYMFAQPGKKLLFMGGEFGQVSEWVHDSSLDWDVLQYACHAQLKTFMAQLNALYRGERALYEVDWNMSGFEWIDCNDAQHSTLSLLRHAGSSEETILVVLNFTPVPRYHYRVGVPRMGFWRELLNSDAREYGGSGHGNLGGAEASPVPYHGRPCSLNLTLPPLGAIFFKL